MRGKTTWANTSASTCCCHAFFLLPNSKALAVSSSNMSNIMDDALMRLIVAATIAVSLRLILSTFVIPSDPSVIFHLNHHHSSSLICTRCLETNQKQILKWWFFHGDLPWQNPSKINNQTSPLSQETTASWVTNVRSSSECSSSWGHPVSPTDKGEIKPKSYHHRHHKNLLLLALLIIHCSLTPKILQINATHAKVVLRAQFQYSKIPF